MNGSIRTRFAPHALLWMLLSGVSSVAAQQRPLTGQMLGDPAAPTTALPAASPAPPAPPQVASPTPQALAKPARLQIGDTTRALLQLQASGERAGASQPVLGDQASASYKRYLDSFTHPIPEFLQKTVRQDGAGTGSSE